MISEWRTYSPEDFVPFTSEVYFRLIERANQALWPLQLVMLTSGLTVVVLLLRDRGRVGGAVLAMLWIWVGVTFLIQRYGVLNWVGFYFGWAFAIEGLILLGVGLAGRFKTATRHTLPEWLGFVAIACGLMVYPLLGPLVGGGWGESEVFGIHPDPTAVATLGVLLIATRGWCLWISSIIPILWCVIGGLTLGVLGAPWAVGLPVSAVLALVGMVWKTLSLAPPERPS